MLPDSTADDKVMAKGALVSIFDSLLTVSTKIFKRIRYRFNHFNEQHGLVTMRYRSKGKSYYIRSYVFYVFIIFYFKRNSCHYYYFGAALPMSSFKDAQVCLYFTDGRTFLPEFVRVGIYQRSVCYFTVKQHNFSKLQSILNILPALIM